MRTLISILTLAISFYMLLSLLLYLFQDKLVFLPNMPGRALDYTPAQIGLVFEDVNLETEDEERIHGWFLPREHARGALLFFHGNAGNISHRLDSLKIFHELGLDVLIIDYRGYGQSSGKASEKGIYRDALAAWEYLVNERGIPAERIIVFGRSLGGAAAAWLAADQEPAGVIIESSFSSALDMAQRLYRFLPTRLLTRLKFEVAENASRIDAPVLVVHSRDDEIIPFSMGQKIHSGLKLPAGLVEMRGDHNNGFIISLDSYVDALDQFLDTVFPPKDPAGTQERDA